MMKYDLIKLLHEISLGVKSVSASEIDYDNMSDEDIDAMLEQISSNGQISSDTAVDDNQDDSSDDDAEEDNIDDTDHSDDDTDDTDTNDQNDDSDNDTDDSGESKDGETNQENVEANKGDADTDSKEEKELDASEAPKTTETGTIDPSEFERYKKFYEEIANAEFVANGKKVKGFTDPKKLIQAQQMSYGYSNKMAEIKKYRPYLAALREKGILDDESKFNYLMSVVDGDKGAIKEHLVKHNISAVDLELDDVEYKPTKSYVANPAALVLEEVFDSAKNLGIDAKLRTVLSEQWDEASFKEFIDEPETRADLIEHVQTGIYDTVMDKVHELEALDYTGKYIGMKTTDKYRAALGELRAEFEAYEAAQAKAKAVAPAQSTQQKPATNVAPELDAATKARLEAEYRAKVEQKNQEAAEARKKAASVSKKKVAVTTTTKFDPLALEGDELDEFVQSMINSGRR